MIFGHFIDFGHFLIEIPIGAKKNFTANGRKGRTSKTKTVLKSVNKTEQLVGMSKSKREKIQNKNHPICQDLFLDVEKYIEAIDN